MKKGELIELARIKKFNSIVLVPETNLDILYYFWMCELQQWLRVKHEFVVDVFQESKDGKYTGNWKVDISLVGNYEKQEYPNPSIVNKNFNVALHLGLMEALKFIII